MKRFYSREPVSIAKLWQLRGAKLLHIVDLDGAITGKPKNLDVVSQIVKAVRIPIQFGGGVRSLEIIEEVFKKGVDKIILSTSAYNSIELVKEAYKSYKDKILVSIDAKDGYVAIKGWRDVTNKR